MNMRISGLGAYLLFSLFLAGCNDGNNGTGNPSPPVSTMPPILDPGGPFRPPQFPPPAEPEPEPTILHFTLQGVGATGGSFPVAGEIRIEQYDGQTQAPVAEFIGTADDAGNIEIPFDDIVETDSYAVSAVADDVWYFAPESVAFHYGKKLSGADLQQEFSQPRLLQFRRNESGIAYFEAVGVVEDFREQFPGRGGDGTVFEITVSAPGLQDTLFTGSCEYYFEDFSLINGAGDTLAGRLLEVFDATEHCSTNHEKFLVAVDREYAEQPGFGTGLRWDSFVFMDPVGEDPFVFILMESSLHYIDEELFGVE